MHAIQETIAPELEEMDGEDPRGSDEIHPGDFLRGRQGPAELRVRAGEGFSVTDVSKQIVTRR